MYADIAFPISSFQTFSYRIPSKFRSVLSVGSRVIAPLSGRKRQGIITAFSKDIDYKGQIKSISEVLDEKPVLSSELWSLINWLSDYYVTPKGQVAKVVLPNNLSVRYTPPKRWYVNVNQELDKKDLIELERRAPKQFFILQRLINSKYAVKVSSLKKVTMNPLTVCKSLEEKGFVILDKRPVSPDNSSLFLRQEKKEILFNENQLEVINKIVSSLSYDRYDPFLLHGVTGSGKTEIYIESVRKCISIGKSAIILLPEISLTPQIAGRFKTEFGDKVAIWHSKLTQSQRSWTWKEICNGSFNIVIGARSAIFVPMKNIGLIVVDEEQESSFKQNAPAPRYHARDVAVMRASIEKSTVLLSSATPSLESYRNHIQGKFEYLYLQKRFGKAQYPKVFIQDMILNQEESGKYGVIFSGLLQDKIEERLNKKEQIILLHNRRGYSTVIRCSDCGLVLTCNSCKVSLIYHQKGSNLRCHYCGLTKKEKPKFCMSCNSSLIKYAGTGIQRVESIIKETFPNACVIRLDADTSKSTSHLTKVIEDFANGKIDILIGTQMIAKGLDFPNATLVGIINSDLGLHLPDFRTGERVFQLIYQASGRAGRKDKPGEVVIQTYVPNNSVIKCAADLNLKEYYDIVLAERKELNYPPYSWISKIEILGPDLGSVEKFSEFISSSLINKFKGLEILGPSPCYLEKLNNQYRFQILFKSSKKLDRNGRKLNKFISINFKGSKILSKMGKNKINIDIDPQSLI